MKTRVLSLVLCIILLLSALAGCDSGETPSSAAAQTEGELYPDFEMPEETDTLVLYSEGLMTRTLTYAVEIFKNTYPNVTVEWDKMEQDEFENRIRTEIPAGRGPDLLYVYGHVLPDINKTMSTKVFEDLNPYIEADDAFSLDDFISGIVEEGVYEGARYVFPVSHFPSIKMTSAEALAEYGCVAADLDSIDGFIELAARFHDRNPGRNCIVNYAMKGSLDTDNLYMFFQYGVLRFLDYEADCVVVDPDNLKKAADFCAMFHGNKPDARDENGREILKLKERSSLFIEAGTGSATIKASWNDVLRIGETPVMVSIPDEEGRKTTAIMGVGAIPRGASNKLNAWRFLKILLSVEIQTNYNALLGICPVNKTAVRGFLTSSVDEGEMNDTMMEIIDQCEAFLTDYDSAVMCSNAVYRCFRDNITPYIVGRKSFEECFDNLVSVLDIYKDE